MDCLLNGAFHKLKVNHIIEDVNEYYYRAIQNGNIYDIITFWIEIDNDSDNSNCKIWQWFIVVK